MKMIAGDHAWDVHKMYSDCGKEITKAMKQYHILTQHGQPDISKSSAIAERATFLRNLSLSGRGASAGAEGAAKS
eukprot:7704386-Alexandrium_andersonii.AAC.1